jgi:hypothetical protein
MKLDRQTCRDHVVKHFSIKTMVSEYEKAYQWVLGNTAAGFDESDELDE